VCGIGGMVSLTKGNQSTRRETCLTASLSCYEERQEVKTREINKYIRQEIIGER